MVTYADADMVGDAEPAWAAALWWGVPVGA